VRWSIAWSGQIHYSGLALHNYIVASSIFLRSAVAETRDGAIDHRWVSSPHSFITETKPFHGREVGCLIALKWRRKGTGIVTFARPFDLDYLGAKVAEQHSAVGPREYSREIKHADTFERSHDGLLT